MEVGAKPLDVIVNLRTKAMRGRLAPLSCSEIA